MPVPLTVTDGRRKVRAKAPSQLTLKPALTSEWRHDKLSAAQSLFVFLPVTPFSAPPSLMSIFLCLSSYPCISDMSTDPCSIRFHKCHSSSIFLLRLTFALCLLCFSQRQNLSWFNHLSHSTWLTVTWSSLTHSHNLPKQRADTIKPTVPELQFTAVFLSQTTSRFLPHVAIETEAVLSLDEDTVLLTSEVRVQTSRTALM